MVCRCPSVSTAPTRSSEQSTKSLFLRARGSFPSMGGSISVAGRSTDLLPRQSIRTMDNQNRNSCLADESTIPLRSLHLTASPSGCGSTQPRATFHSRKPAHDVGLNAVRTRHPEGQVGYAYVHFFYERPRGAISKKWPFCPRKFVKQL